MFSKNGAAADMLNRLLSDAKSFNDSTGKGSVKDKTNNVANKNINAAIAALNENVRQFDLLIMHFAETDPGFTEQYFVTKKLNDAGVRHRGVSGKLITAATGLPVENAVVRLAGNAKSVSSVLCGIYQVIMVKPGKCRLEVVVKELVIKSVVIDIQRGKILELDIAVCRKFLFLYP